MGGTYRAVMGLGLFLSLGLLFLGRRWLLPWQGLLLVGLMQALAVNGALLPVISSAQQQPVKEAALVARLRSEKVVSYQTRMPSFSLYRQAITPHRDPQPGELAFLRKDKLAALKEDLARQDLDILFQKGGIMLVKVPADED
jgi:hypothetical protein